MYSNRTEPGRLVLLSSCHKSGAELSVISGLSKASIWHADNVLENVTSGTKGNGFRGAHCVLRGHS